MDVVPAADRLTYRVVGGVLDLFFLLGPSPLDVMDQLTRLVGRPALPAYWALGLMNSKRAPARRRSDLPPGPLFWEFVPGKRVLPPCAAVRQCAARWAAWAAARSGPRALRACCACRAKRPGCRSQTCELPCVSRAAGRVCLRRSSAGAGLGEAAPRRAQVRLRERCGIRHHRGRVPVGRHPAGDVRERQPVHARGPGLHARRGLPAGRHAGICGRAARPGPALGARAHPAPPGRLGAAGACRGRVPLPCCPSSAPRPNTQPGAVACRPRMQRRLHITCYMRCC